jgi:hypothetical protein
MEKYLSKCCRCGKEIAGASDYGRQVRKPDGTYDDLCIDCGKELTLMQLRHSQELDQWFKNTK